MLKRVARIGKTLYGVFGILLIWMLLDLIIKSAVVPAPLETISYFVRHMDQVLMHLIYSFYRIVMAISASLLIGIPLGMVMGLLRWGDSILSPIVYLAYPIPKIAFLPVFMILFGLGDTSKIVLIFSIIVFQIMIGVRDGIKAIPQEVHLSSQSLGLNSWDKIRHIIFPSILPKLLSSLRISIGIAMSALFLGENYATTYGIGYYIMNNWIMVDYLAMFAGIVGLSLMGLLIFSGIDRIESRWCRWTK